MWRQKRGNTEVCRGIEFSRLRTAAVPSSGPRTPLRSLPIYKLLLGATGSLVDLVIPGSTRRPQPKPALCYREKGTRVSFPAFSSPDLNPLTSTEGWIPLFSVISRQPEEPLTTDNIKECLSTGGGHATLLLLLLLGPLQYYVKLLLHDNLHLIIRPSINISSLLYLL